MKKLDFYKAAMKANAFARKAWAISAFAVINEDLSAWQKDPYSYRVVQTQTGYHFVDPEKGNQLTPLEDCVVGEPPLRFTDVIELKAGDFPNVKKDIKTLVGNVFFNCVCIVYAFYDKIDFLEGNVSVRKIEEMLPDRMEDDGTDKKGCIYVSEYLKFVDSISYLTNFTQLCVWAATEKSMTGPPGVNEFKQQLLKKHEGHLDDPAVIAEIDAALVKFDAEYLKGDPSENFLISKKSREVVRKKMFLMSGAESGLSEAIKVDLIQNSLEQGWEISKFPAMNNSLRAGSFNRGAQTQLGGESVKWLLRASSNIAATLPDCGSTVGRKMKVSNENVAKLVGFNVITTSGPDLVNNVDEAGKYLGKAIMVRSPMFCKLDKTDYCLVCVGKRLAQNPTAISLAISEYGSAFLSLFMKKMHGTSLSVAKMDYKTAIT